MVGFGEAHIVKYLNKMFETKGIHAFAWRIPQLRYRLQVADIVVDSPLPEFFMVIEVKSCNTPHYFNIDTRKRSKAFNSTQLEIMCNFADKTGRLPYYVIAYRPMRKVTHGKATFYTVDAYELLELYKAGRKRISLHDECYEGIIFPAE